MAVRTLTLTPAAVSTVTVTTASESVAVYNTGNVSNNVTVTTNGVDPVADADDNYTVPAGARRELQLGPTYDADTGAATRTPSVKLLSAGAVKVEVEFA